MHSLLFVPANVPRMWEKARASGTDVVIYDLEDAVQSGAKDEARDILRQQLTSRGEQGAATAIRVNSLKTAWHASDVELIKSLRPDYVMLPKTDGPHDIDALARGLSGECERTGILAVVTETVASVLSLAAADWRHPRLEGMLWGAEDLAADIGAIANRLPSGDYAGPFCLARNLCLLAARRAGVIAIDAVFTDFRSSDGLRQEAEQARRDGFDAKAAIHPAQVPIINEVFRPSEEERRWAEAVLVALACSETGVAVVDGTMVDAPHAARARRILGAS